MDSEQPSIQDIVYAIHRVIGLVVVVLSLVLISGLLVPLLIQLKNGSFHQNATGGRRRRPREPPYSTYNLYLVHLALIDLIYFGLTMATDIMAVTQKYNPRFYSRTVYVVMNDPPPVFFEGNGTPPPIHLYLGPAYTMANMCINAIIAYEVLKLLKATHRAQRINQPPSLTRVNLQAGGVIFGSMLCGVLYYYSLVYGWFGPIILVGTMMCFLSFVYVIGVSILVKWRGYMPAVNGSTPRDRAVRGLAFYFLRITLIFIVIWLPAVVIALLTTFGFVSSLDALAKTIVGLLMYIQPIITFCMALTKSDVKKYIKDIVTLKYIFGDCSCDCCRDNNNNKELPVRANKNNNEKAPATANSFTILGYHFPDADANAAADDNEDTTSDADAVDNADVIARVEAGAYTCGDADPDVTSPMFDDGDDYVDDGMDDDMDDDTGDSNDKHTDVENGTRKDKSRMLRGGAVTVLATGEVVPVEAQTATASPNRE